MNDYSRSTINLKLFVLIAHFPFDEINGFYRINVMFWYTRSIVNITMFAKLHSVSDILNRKSNQLKCCNCLRFNSDKKCILGYLKWKLSTELSKNKTKLKKVMTNDFFCNSAITNFRLHCSTGKKIFYFILKGFFAPKIFYLQNFFMRQLFQLI